MSEATAPAVSKLEWVERADMAGRANYAAKGANDGSYAINAMTIISKDSSPFGYRVSYFPGEGKKHEELGSKIRDLDEAKALAEADHRLPYPLRSEEEQQGGR